MTIVIILSLLSLILAALILPVVKKKSWLQILAALALSFVAVVLPLFVFFCSSIFGSWLMPEWKGGCAHDWLDCFIAGKLALAPLVLFATATLYAVEIFHVERRSSPKIVLGIFLGAVVAIICLVIGLICIGWSAWMLVPLYVAVWYSVRAAQLMKTSGLDWRTYFYALIGSLPFWLLSVWWSKSLYASLPDKAPDGCFVATAAGRGHKNFVGPFFEIERHGRKVKANQQLITLWQFENLWRSQSPRSHQNFRRFYNHFGPLIASRIKSPWLADLTFVSLKPVEIIAKRINQKTN